MADTITFKKAPQVEVRQSISNMNTVYSFNKTIEKALPSVVNISVERTQYGHKAYDSLGSGVIVSSDGYIVTNYHVIKNQRKIKVKLFHDKKEYIAKLIGSDEDSDLAVIKIEKKALRAIEFGDSDSLKIGDISFAIGNPFGLDETVTFGIVSALNKNKLGLNRFENYIQTDASINPGNSGGALVDTRGVLIGINSASYSTSYGGGSNGIGFAIPVNRVKKIVEILIEEGKVVRGYLGISTHELEPKQQAAYHRKEGAIIFDIEKYSPASKIDLQRGDLIYGVNGKSIANPSDLKLLIADLNPDNNTTISLERDFKEMNITAQLQSTKDVVVIKSDKKILGGLYISIPNENSDQQEGGYAYGAPTMPTGVKGVLITNVEPKSRAENAGFVPRDIIVQIGNQKVESVNDLQKALRKYNKDVKKIFILRNNGTTTMMFVLK
jgi:serine protease Do